MGNSKLEHKYKNLEKALDSLEEGLKKLQEMSPEDYYYKMARDSCIQRFEFSIDTLWKYLKEYIQLKFGVTVIPSPKSIFRKSEELKIINKEEFLNLLKMVDDRNITSHTYHEELAEKISYAIPDYYKILNKVFLAVT